MTQYNQSEDKPGPAVKLKRGVPTYARNPSVPSPDSISKKRPVRIGNDQKGFVIDGGGEILGKGAAMFYEFEEVDDARFVKLYLSGFKKAAALSKAGLSVFELVYRQVQDSPNNDKVELSFDMIEHSGVKLTRSTYFRGLRELLDHEFLFKSLIDGVFFVNILYMFNGNRLALVKGYQRKSTKTVGNPGNQIDLFS
jgi:hypothetical protein